MLCTQVYALHKRFVDPRRPMRAKLTPEEMEEQLLPYNSELVLYPTQFATLDKQVRTFVSYVCCVHTVPLSTGQDGTMEVEALK